MLEFRSVTKAFGENVVLRDLSFRTNEGEILFILGTSGTGKSVLLKLIVGLLRVTSGEIYLNSQKISNLSEEEFFPVRRKCGMVFQHPALFDSMSVLENVAFGIRELSDEEMRARVIETLKVVDLGEDTLPLKTSRLSYGMQKRVSLARTLAVKPDVLLFDEPTTGLDPVTTRSVNQLIRSSSKEYKCTSLVVSHDMESALTLADRILVLSKGRIVELATPQEIRKSQVPLVREFLSEVLETEVSP